MTNVLRVMTVTRLKPPVTECPEADGTPSEVLIRDCQVYRVEAIVDQGRREQLLTMNKTQGKAVFKCAGMELPWRGNNNNVSRIPAGVYVGVREKHPKYGWLYRLQSVPNRSGVLFGHIGNWAGDKSQKKKANSEGCLLLGKRHTMVGGQYGVTDSGLTMKGFADTVSSGPTTCLIEIIDPR